MRLSCTEVAMSVSILSIAAETGFSVSRIRKHLTKKGVRPSSGGGFNNCNIYPSVLVREAFKGIKY